MGWCTQSRDKRRTARRNHRDVARAIGESDYVDSQRFNKLHRLVIGLDHGDLETTLREGDFDVDDTDSSGRTSLYWAASRGDVRKVRL